MACDDLAFAGHGDAAFARVSPSGVDAQLARLWIQSAAVNARDLGDASMRRRSDKHRRLVHRDSGASDFYSTNLMRLRLVFAILPRCVGV